MSIDRLVLVRNGEEAEVVDLDPSLRETLRHEAEHTLTFDESGWVLIRVTGETPSTPPALEAGEGLVPASAFTAPIWIEVDDGEDE